MPRYLLYFDFISGFKNHSVGEEIILGSKMKWLRPPDKLLKWVRRFGVLVVILMSPLFGVFSRGPLAKETATTSGEVNQRAA